jgi:ferric-dicitrate binding protein FerR (iron transport regulator)
MESKMEENYELAKWLAGEMSEAELQAFQKTPAYETYHKIAQYSSQLEAPAFNADKVFEKIIAQPKQSGKIVSLHQTLWFKIAAIFVLFLGLTFFYKTNIAVTETASNGTQSTFTLPDNSSIVLNSGSEVEYNKWTWDQNRALQLSGEAYFKVAKGKKFEVNTNLGTVTVLGTQFNVKARKNRFDVTCYEGRVKVNYQNQEIIITKGKRVSFENGLLIAIPDTMVLQPEWTSGELAFVNENLTAIISELERQFDCSIDYKGASTSQLFTGTLPAKNLDDALQILASTYHLKSKKESDHKITLELLDVEK